MPARTASLSRTRPAVSADVGQRLPWWAIVLPALAFAALLLLIVTPGDAQAAASAEPALSRFFEHLQQALLHRTP